MPVSQLPALHTTGTFPELALHNHELRMDAVVTTLVENDVRNVIDLGCGDGALLKKIAYSGLNLDTYLGVDTRQDRLEIAQSDADPSDVEIAFLEGSMTELAKVLTEPEDYRHLGAIVMIEAIEHVPIESVGDIESGVFGHVSPDLVVVTTPDATKRLNDEQLKARGHHFELDIPEFQEWAANVTDQYTDYSVDIQQLGGPTFVRNTQIAAFNRNV